MTEPTLTFLFQAVQFGIHSSVLFSLNRSNLWLWFLTALVNLYLSSSANKANIHILVYFSIYNSYILLIYFYILFGFHTILLFKFPNSNNNIVLIFWGLLGSLVPISQKLIKLTSGIFSLGYFIFPKYVIFQLVYFFYLLLFWSCFCISLGVCVCKCLVIHTQPNYYLWGFFSLFGSITYYSLFFVKCN